MRGSTSNCWTSAGSATARSFSATGAPASRAKPSANPLGQLDDDPLGAADVTEPVDVFVALQLADELRAVGSQARDRGVDVVDCECDMADAAGVRRRVAVAAMGRRVVELDQLEPSVTVRR